MTVVSTIELNISGIIKRNLTGFGFPVLRRMIRYWQAQRQLQSLQAFDDSILADIGITRDDLHYGQQLSSRADVMAEMNSIREQRIGRRTGRS